jgi:hypothetical protein
MLQYPVELGIASVPSGDEGSETDRVSNVADDSAVVISQHGVSALSMGTGEVPSALSARSVMVGDTDEPDETNSAMGDSMTMEEMDREFDTEMLSRSLYSGKLVQRIVDDDEEDDDSELRHVIDVLGLTAASRRSIKAEGIRQVADIYDIEDLLQQGKVSGLRSVKTAKLLQFLAWVKYFQANDAQGSMPNMQRDFTAEEYQDFIEGVRTQKHTHVWPFPGVDDSEASTLLQPVLHSLNDMVATDEERVVPQTFSQQDIRSARIRALYSLAEQSHRDFHAGSGGNLKEAMDRYRLVAHETAVSVDDCMLQAFSCIKLAILLHRIEFQNHREAMVMMEMAAVKFKVPSAMLFYGAALATGHGGVVKDFPAGTAMLQDAAAAGIGEAYYVLGTIHEGGSGGERDLNAAQQFYDSAAHSFRSSEMRGWGGMFADTTTQSNQQIQSNDDAPDTAGATHWEFEFTAARGLINVDDRQSFLSKEGSCCDAGEGISWGFIVQAILVAAAAILSRSTQASHYPALLPMVPCLGILLALWLMTHAIKVLVGGRAMTRQVRKMQEAKLTAFRHMLKAGPSHGLLFPPLNYFILWFYRCSKWVLVNGGSCAGGTKSRIETLEAKILWVEMMGSMAITGLMSWLAEALAVLLALAFLVVWVVLLTQEVYSYKDECSSWWDNTCQGSPVLCNEDAIRQETCALVATTDFQSYTFKLIPISR